MKSLLMTKILAKNLFKGPATLMYPKKKRVFYAGTRGKIENDIEKCIFCGICSKRCPNYALAVSKDPKEWEIDRLKCCNCNLCVEVCPKHCLFAENHYFQPVTKKTDALYKLVLPPTPEHDQDNRLKER